MYFCNFIKKGIHIGNITSMLQFLVKPYLNFDELKHFWNTILTTDKILYGIYLKY